MTERKRRPDMADATVITPGGPRPAGRVHEVGPGQAVRADTTAPPVLVPRRSMPSRRKPPAGSILTPGGFRPGSAVHMIEQGHVLDATEGHMRKRDSSGNVVGDFGSTGRAEASALSEGWITSAQWNASPSNPVTSFRTTWVVPEEPANQSRQTIFLFNGMQGFSPLVILQPVLQWGELSAGARKRWAVASWIVFGNGSAFVTKLVNVKPGDTLVGVMTLANPSGPVFAYSCEFEGIDGTTLAFLSSQPLTQLVETLEAYDLDSCSAYPDSRQTAFRRISVRTGTTTPTLKWSAQDQVTDCGQHTRVVSNSATNGEVDIVYRGSGSDSRWDAIGGFFPAGAPVSAVARTPDNLDLFITGNNGVVFTSWWRPGSDWSGVNNNWRAIGGTFPHGAPVSAVARTPDNLDLFITGNNGVVFTSWWHPGADWSGLGNHWKNIGGVFPPAAPVSAVARRPDNLDLFITGNNGVVFTSWWHPGADWSGIGDHWTNIGGVFPPGAPVSAVARAPDNLDLFITGSNGVVFTSFWNPRDGWSGLGNHWTNIGGVFPAGAPVSAVARTPDNLDLFITGGNGVVYTSSWNPHDGWSGLGNRWTNIGGVFPPGAPVSAVARTPDSLDLFVTGNNGVVFTSSWNPRAGWSGVGNHWTPIDGTFPNGAPLAGVARNPAKVDLFLCGKNGIVYTQRR